MLAANRVVELKVLEVVFRQVHVREFSYRTTALHNRRGPLA
jgi:hypothetical protein